MVSKKSSVKKNTGKKSAKKVPVKRSAAKRTSAKKKPEKLIENAKEEKDLYEAIPRKYKKKMKDLVNQCKNQGYVVSDVLMEHIGLEECDNTENTWECMENILKHNCIDLVEEGGLLQEIETETDPRFPEMDPSLYDSIQMYLRDIGKYPLLSAQEERELGKKIALRRSILSGRSRKKMTPAERRKLLEEGLKARNKPGDREPPPRRLHSEKLHEQEP